MSSNFSDETAKICFVAARPTSTLRRYLRIVAERFSDSKRNFSPEHIISECLDLVPRGCMTMDILLPGFTAHFFKNGLYHFVVSVYKKKRSGSRMFHSSLVPMQLLIPDPLLSPWILIKVEKINSDEWCIQTLNFKKGNLITRENVKSQRRVWTSQG